MTIIFKASIVLLESEYITNLLLSISSANFSAYMTAMTSAVNTEASWGRENVYVLFEEIAANLHLD